MTPQEKLKKRNALSFAIKQAELGKLANVKILNLISAIWLQKDRPSKDASEFCGLDYVPLPQLEELLSKKLLDAVKNGNTELLQDVIKSIEFLQTPPEPFRFTYPDDPARAAILKFFRGDPEAKVTAVELCEILSNHPKGVKIEERTLRRICRENQLPLEKAKVGRKPKIKDIKKSR